jgi:amidase
LDVLTARPARELARLVRTREVSAVELLDAHLARIDVVDADVNAVVSLDADRARDEATAADAALAAGDRVGPLHGIPMTLKDGHDVAGMRTTVGVPELDRVATQDGTVAARLRAAGAVIVGHTCSAGRPTRGTRLEHPVAPAAARRRRSRRA